MRLNQGYRYRHIALADAGDSSLVAYLARAFSHSTEEQWKERITAGEVLVNGQFVTETAKVIPGSELVWNRPGWLEEDTPQEYRLIYEDHHLLVVDKPSGLPTLPGAGFYLNTLLSLVRERFPEANPVHRLGRATSGLVIFARTAHAAAVLQRQWSAVHKQYRALAHFVAKEHRYEILSPIGMLDHPRLGKVYAACPKGKAARSVARAIGRRASSTLFEVDLHTGRPHQIRIHLAYIGHPLVGDPLYDIGGAPKADQPGLPGDAGYWLHAERLELAHPVTGGRLKLRSTPPPLLSEEG
jgi:23S rRNA pseudouridine1911/1915/1917 synthase